jgi:hypothetical protein
MLKIYKYLKKRLREFILNLIKLDISDIIKILIHLF